MALVSRLFRADPALEKCLVLDSAHVTPGTVGPHVYKIQKALMLLDGVLVADEEVDAMQYGATTTAAVLAYKKQRKIINFTYQKAADDIVGKMTVAAMDKELFARQGPAGVCSCGDKATGGGGRAPAFKTGLSAFRSGSSSAVPVKGSSLPVVGKVGANEDTPTDLNCTLNVAFQTAIGPGKTTPTALRAMRSRFAFETAATALLKPWGMKLNSTVLPSFDFPFSISPAEASEAQKLREFAEKSTKTGLNVLRVILVRFDNNREETGFSGGPEFGGKGFKEYVVCNTNLLRKDGATMLHEMIHCSASRFFHDSAHDLKKDHEGSVFTQNDDRDHIRKLHAEALAASFFHS